MKTTLHSKKIYTPQGPIEGYLTIEDGTIRSITQTSTASAVEELGDAMILPGIIDLHSHGYRGWSAKTIDPQEIQGLSASLPSIGVTATLATTTAGTTPSSSTRISTRRHREARCACPIWKGPDDTSSTHADICVI